MKSKYTFLSILACSIALISCKNDEKEEAETAATSTTPQQIIVPRVEPIPGQQAYAQPSQQITMPAANPQSVPQAPAAAKAGMNPAHGQPGHRCDIAVGAPLNSAPAKPAAGKGNASQVIIPTTTAGSTPAILTSNGAAATPTAPGMNPPHGQPGHVCGTPVGSPLPKAGEAAAETKTETKTETTAE